MGALVIIAIVSAVLPYIPGLIQDAEEIFGAGTGQHKKQYVVDALTKAAEGSLAGASASGAAPNVTPLLQKLEPSFARVVDMTVSAMSAGGILPKPQPKPAPALKPQGNAEVAEKMEDQPEGPPVAYMGTLGAGV